jgi:hypothetical protein
MTPQLEQTLMAEEETTSGEAKFSVTPLARAFLVPVPCAVDDGEIAHIASGGSEAYAISTFHRL